MRDQVSLGPILDEEFTDREIQPKTLELRLKRVICHEDFKNEWGKDELIFAAVAHDIYHRQDIEFAPRELGKFKKGDNKPLNDLLIASIPVAQGSWRDAAYPVALYLAEKALGGFAKAVEELRGLSSHEMRDLFLLLHAVSLFSLMGMSVAAEKGFDAHGLAKALSIGLGPLVYCALYIGIVASSWPIALAWLGVVGQDKLLAVLGLGLLETIGDALKDDLFPPQAIAFHFGVPDGLGDAGALDFGSPTRVVQPFKFIQKGLARGQNVVHYDLEFEWRVVPGIGEASPPPPPAEETDDPILARGNLLLQNVANPGNAEFAAQIAQLQDIMGYYPAEAAPTFDLSATEFAVCDRWYSSYPGNTWVNRTFSLTGRPARQENFARDIDKDIDKDERDAMLAALEGTEHEDHAKFITDNDMPFDEVSFFRLLDQHRYQDQAIDWAFYSQDMPTLLAVDASYASDFRNRLQGRPNRIRPLDRFFKDAEQGELPQVFWVDPNFMDIGDMRENLGNWDPGMDTDGYRLSHLYDLNTANDDHPPGDIAHGQHFVLQIFNALFNSPQWSKTLLIVVYDEHGGFFDPVTPPYLESEPESPAFRSLGVRVPALVVSPWVGRQLVSHRRFDHTSIIKTISPSRQPAKR